MTASIRMAFPQLLTFARLVLGAGALIAGIDHVEIRAATFITLAAVLDGLDGRVARWLGATSVLGALFDYFADYLAFVVAPWALTRSLISPQPGGGLDWLLALPLGTAAFRYARNSQLVVGRPQEVRELPGLGTVFFAFLSVTSVFLGARQRMSSEHLTLLLSCSVTIFSVLMVVPVRYPKLTVRAGASPVALVLLTAMPFVATQTIAGLAVILGVAYVVAGPLAGTRSGPRGPSSL